MVVITQGTVYSGTADGCSVSQLDWPKLGLASNGNQQKSIHFLGGADETFNWIAWDNVQGLPAAPSVGQQDPCVVRVEVKEPDHLYMSFEEVGVRWNIDQNFVGYEAKWALFGTIFILGLHEIAEHNQNILTGVGCQVPAGSVPNFYVGANPMVTGIFLNDDQKRDTLNQDEFVANPEGALLNSQQDWCIITFKLIDEARRNIV